ncbi:hypothetical protein SDC9_109389 [bioreactor metagenome]|uniref:Uncharacterized protein n=1 Tax=bioreactor metagenome TaxID=1076179 RepID=A0A645BBP6_9ZZZZ
MILMIMKAKNIILIAIILISYNGNKKSENNNIKKPSVSNDISTIAPLVDGEIIELKGVSHPIEPFVKVSGTEMLTLALTTDEQPFYSYTLSMPH